MLLLGVLVGVLLGPLGAGARRADAHCQSTTCSTPKPAPDCIHDNDTGCWDTGLPLAWRQSCVSFSVNRAGSPKLGLDYDAALQIVSSAFARWPNTMCPDGTFPSISVESFGPETCNALEYNSNGPNTNAVMFRDDAWPHDTSIIALTTVTFNRKTGEILDADMEINTVDSSVNVSNLPYIVTHESGHFFGLDHSRDQNSIMFPQYSGLQAAAAMLNDDDIISICNAYPESRPMSATCDFEPTKGFAPDCGGDVIGSCAVNPAPAVRTWSARALRVVWLPLVAGLASAVVVAGRRARGRRQARDRHRDRS